jgi:multiple sugar transport system substrate-binding protein/sn-glycerol 3-phosphate transport system substrate-binding protein
MLKNKFFWTRLMAILLVAAFVLSACQPKATPTTVAPTNPPATAVPTVAPDAWENVDPKGQTVLFWHQHTSERATSLNEIIDEFNKTNEWGITVVGEYQGSYNEVFQKMLTFMNTADAPNLVVAYQNQAATYQIADALVDMNPLADSPKWGLTPEEQADFFPGFFAQDVFPNFNNQRLGLAPNRSMEVMYYNMDWLKELGYTEPPKTPEQFKEMACKATNQPFSKATVEGSIGYELSVDASRFASWTFAFGGDMYDYQNGKYTYDSAAAQAAMTFLQDLFKSGCATIVTESYGDQTDFGSGKLLFSIGSSSGLPFYQTAVDGGGQFEWSVAPIPYTGDKPVMNIYGASVSIPKTTPEQELAAWLFLKYYTSPEVQAKWAKASQYFPVRASVAEGMADYFAANPAYKAAFDLLQYGHFEPPVPGYDFVRTMVNNAMSAIVAEPWPNVAETLTKLNTDGNASLTEQLALMPEPSDPYYKVDPTGQKITFWHNFTKTRKDTLDAIVADFNANNKYGIVLTAENQGGYTDIFNKMLVNLNTETAPDLVVAYQNQAATYQVAEALINIDTLIASPKWGLSIVDKNDYIASFWKQDLFPNFKNQRLGFPAYRSAEVMYYNVDWLKELGYDAPPATPEEFKEMACKAAATPFSKNTSGVSYGYTLSYGNDVASNVPSWTFAFGGDMFDYKKGQYAYNSAAGVEAAAFLQDIFKNGCATMASEAYGEQANFGAGVALFSVGSTSGLPNYKSAIEAGGQFEWGIAALPNKGKAVTNIYGASISIPKTTPERQLAAWLFLKYFTTPEVQAKWAEASGYFPVRISVAEGMADYFAANPIYKAGFDLLKSGKFEPPTVGYDFVRIKVTSTLVSLLADPYPDVQAALDQLTADANTIMAEQLTVLPTPVPTKQP